MGDRMKIHVSGEDYLEAVLVLQKQKGYARCVDVSEFLGVTKPSVSRAVKELSKKKCLLKKDDGTLSLTEQGQSIAKQIYEKHRFFTKQLIKAGVPCDIAEAEAERGCNTGTEINLIALFSCPFNGKRKKRCRAGDFVCL